MYTVYILQNSASGRYYIGSTNNLIRRLTEHNRGQTTSTHRQGIWKVIATEAYQDKESANKRELVIKSYKGGNAFKNLLAGVVQQ